MKRKTFDRNSWLVLRHVMNEQACIIRDWAPRMKGGTGQVTGWVHQAVRTIRFVLGEAPPRLRPELRSAARVRSWAAYLAQCEVRGALRRSYPLS